ncbi:MAG: GAP family protein, partial [Stackebrandtia sp.]
ILMLLSGRATRTAPAFALGWLAGILIVAVAVMLFVPASAASQSGGGSVTGWIKLVLGALFLVMALGQWRQRPKPGEDPKLPKWMAGIDHMGPGAAAGLGLVLSAVNPKNLSLGLAAGLSLAQAGGGSRTVGLIVFAILAASSVVAPVVAYLLFRQGMSASLAALKDWLTHNNATVMFVVLLVLGVVLIGKGLGTLAP